MASDIAKFIEIWEGSDALEKSAAIPFFIELCTLLGVPAPVGGGDASYTFEREVRAFDELGQPHTRWMDFYKEGHFIIEAKKGSRQGAKKVGTAKRGTDAWYVAMNKAHGQALAYARCIENPVPILIVCDVGHCFDMYACFDGTGAYRPFPTAQTNRLYLRDLDRHTDTLRLVFTDPLSLDPSRIAAKVTREVAEYLGNLALRLEQQGHAQQTIARFLMRCLFTMFAEDIGLLDDHIFTRMLRESWVPHPRSFPAGIQALWDAMNKGGATLFGKVRHFNGGLFADTSALPLDEHALRLLLVAADRDWTDVEPAIFGTLLERALDKDERHRLGAHYTPKAYVERLVRPAIEEPLRKDWEEVRIKVEALRKQIEEAEAAKKPGVAKKRRAEASSAVHDFHRKLCGTRVLDPACGSGNFLYVALHLFQQIESEVFGVLESLGEKQDLLRLEGLRVTPAQFLGIEIKPWAKEITELVLWIGYLQWHFRMLDKKPPIFEPVLHDYQNIENRDAILSYDTRELVLDEKGKPVTRWDGKTTKPSKVTGKEVPDESATVPVYRYTNPRKAEWPRADFIIGNPPFVGNKRMQTALGQEYVRVLRDNYPEVPESVDYVMYWWFRAAQMASFSKICRAGLITTNSITQSFNRRVVQGALSATPPVHIAYAIPDHPWVDAADGADVRIAMTVVAPASGSGTLAEVTREAPGVESLDVDLALRTGIIRANLAVSADVASASRLRANAGICGQGMKLVGDGFFVDPAFAPQDRSVATGDRVVRHFIGPQDVLRGLPGRYVIDFCGLSEDEARRSSARAYHHVLTNVKPLRDQNKRASIRELWWRFAWERPVLRRAIKGLSFYFVTLETSKHRFFSAVAANALWDGSLFAVASDDWYVGGVLSSGLHVAWSLAAGSRLGVGNDPRYNNSLCFETFPFPDPPPALRKRIAALAESLDAHRKARQAEHPGLTITGMYNVLEKLRAGEPLDDKDRAIHEKALVSVLQKIHDDLDAAVFDAYGWPHDLTAEQILERLVALNTERAEEEKQGLVRWLRPDFQNPTGKQAATQTTLAGAEGEPAEGEGALVPAAARVWPKKMAEQVSAVRDVLAGSTALWTTERVAGCFQGAKAKDVEPVLESLAALGLALPFDGEDGARWKAVTAPAL